MSGCQDTNSFRIYRNSNIPATDKKSAEKLTLEVLHAIKTKNINFIKSVFSSKLPNTNFDKFRELMKDITITSTNDSNRLGEFLILGGALSQIN